MSSLPFFYGLCDGQLIVSIMVDITICFGLQSMQMASFMPVYQTVGPGLLLKLGNFAFFPC
jgi:hypothetical protein